MVQQTDLGPLSIYAVLLALGKFLLFILFLVLVLNEVLTQGRLVSPCRWSVWMQKQIREKLVKFNNNCTEMCSCFYLYTLLLHLSRYLFK